MAAISLDGVLRYMINAIFSETIAGRLATVSSVLETVFESVAMVAVPPPITSPSPSVGSLPALASAVLAPITFH